MNAACRDKKLHANRLLATYRCCHRSFLREHEAAVLPAVTTELKSAVADGVAISADQVRLARRHTRAKGYSVEHKGCCVCGTAGSRRHASSDRRRQGDQEERMQCTPAQPVGLVPRPFARSLCTYAMMCAARCHRVLQVLDEASMATGPNKPFHSQMYTFVTKAASQASRPNLTSPRRASPPHICAGPLRICSRTWSQRSSATSALGLGHVCAGTARRWRSWRRRALGCARGAPLRMSCHVPVSASHHLCPFARRRCAASA